MSKAKYTITKSVIQDEQGRSIKTYGLKSNDIVVPDISCHKQTVLNLIERLGNEELDAKQLMYIIEDIII